MAKNILTITFEDGSLIILRLRKSGGYVIYYQDTEEETKLVNLSEEINFDLAKSIFFMVADRWGWEEEEEEVEEEEEDEDNESEED